MITGSHSEYATVAIQLQRTGSTPTVKNKATEEWTNQLNATGMHFDARGVLRGVGAFSLLASLVFYAEGNLGIVKYFGYLATGLSVVVIIYPRTPLYWPINGVLLAEAATLIIRYWAVDGALIMGPVFGVLLIALLGQLNLKGFFVPIFIAFVPVTRELIAPILAKPNERALKEYLDIRRLIKSSQDKAFKLTHENGPKYRCMFHERAFVALSGSTMLAIPYTRLTFWVEPYELFGGPVIRVGDVSEGPGSALRGTIDKAVAWVEALAREHGVEPVHVEPKLKVTYRHGDVVVENLGQTVVVLSGIGSLEGVEESIFACEAVLLAPGEERRYSFVIVDSTTTAVCAVDSAGRSVSMTLRHLI